MNKKKKYKLFKHLMHCLDKFERGELVDLTKIYEDYGCPYYVSPRRILDEPIVKQLIEMGVKKYDMQVEKVIRYSGNRVYAHIWIAMAYLDAFDEEHHDMLIKCMLIIKRIMDEATNRE